MKAVSLAHDSRRRVVVAALAFGLSIGAAAWLQPAQAQFTGLPDFTGLVEQVGPAVVNIRTLERGRAGTARSGVPEMDEDMLEFFRRFGIPIPNQPGPRGGPRQAPDGEPQQRGVGSGFILSADGYVMTNAHVVEGADEVLVTLTDTREFTARMIGADKRSDVALVKIEASGLPVVKIGDVNKLRVGEWVMAIGSPFGLENTVTAGIVSAKARDTGELLPLIQTDVAINPGNSGGPLLNLRGEVVGINSQIYSRTGGFMGISFAIPIDEATRVSEQLRTTGRVVRGRIGVSIDQVTKEVAEAIGLPKPAGALVRSVEAGGPAEKAGVEPGDIITKFEGKVIERSSDLPRTVTQIKPGSKAALTVFRRGQSRDLSVVVGEPEPERTRRVAERSDEPKPAAAAATALGVTVAELTETQKRELKVKSGVRVESVDGIAARAGIREGDVLLSLDNTEITGAKQFEALAAKLDRTKPATVLVRRGEVVNFIVIRPAR